MATTMRQQEFRGDDRDDRQPIVAAMVELAALPGTGWINFDAGVDTDVPVPSRSLIGNVLAARGPDLPHCSWVPQPNAPTSIGIQYASGARAVARLADAGMPLPAGWRMMQDHPRRGLVLAVPASASPDDHDEVLVWLLRAGRQLSTVPLNGYWLATIHQRTKKGR